MIPMQQITPSHTRTPDEFTPEYDWRTEPWLDENGPTDCEMHAAFCIVTAFAADANDDKPNPKQAREDAVVFALLRPDIMERFWKSDSSDDVIRFRLVHAVAQCLASVREAWIRTHGSIDASGAEGGQG